MKRVRERAAWRVACTRGRRWRGRTDGVGTTRTVKGVWVTRLGGLKDAWETMIR
jgi:hypothetical protein